MIILLAQSDQSESNIANKMSPSDNQSAQIYHRKRTKFFESINGSRELSRTPMIPKYNTRTDTISADKTNFKEIPSRKFTKKLDTFNKLFTWSLIILIARGEFLIILL